MKDPLHEVFSVFSLHWIHLEDILSRVLSNSSVFTDLKEHWLRHYFRCNQ